MRLDDIQFALRTDYIRLAAITYQSFGLDKNKGLPKKSFIFCEDRTIKMFLRFRCLDLNTRHNHSTSLRFCFQGCLQRHFDFRAADKDHLDFLF